MAELIRGAGGGGCFRKGTKVQLQHGKTITIEDLKIGDAILAFDESGNLHEAKVTKVHVHVDPQPIMRVKFWRGEVCITSNHWVLNQYGNFVEIGTLTTEDAVVDGMGHLRPIIDAEYIGEEPVYNLTVEPHHTFIADGIRVHNGGHRERFPVIKGSGGGGGKGGGGGGSARVAQEAPDSLRSRAYAQIIDLIGEGEVGGLVDGLKSVYLDDTPIQNADGSTNFTGITLETRTGTQSQSYIPGFSSVENELNVGLEVKTTTSLVRTITNSSVNAARVTISVPALTRQDASTGDISGTSVSFAIDVQTDGGGYVTRVSDTISGKTTSKYSRAYRIDLSGTGPWDIRVRRLTEDSTSSAIQNKTVWSSYAEIIDAKLRYPNSALVGLRVDAAQFQSIPSRSYEMKLLKVQVPSNYDPTTRVYTGSWDGTFQVAWTDNPAWCFYDLLTSERYGLGRFLQAGQVDKWGLYQIAKYCDELVPDGFGGFEPRFTCNVYIQGRQDAYKVVQDFASCFRSMAYWASGSVSFSQDAPTDASALFTNANVVDGTFVYTGSSSKVRHTVALVRWTDPEDMYRQKVEYVEDRDGIDRYGYIETDVTAFACTSRGQANRIGRWILFTERLETESVTFKVGLEGAIAAPGQVIKVADKERAGARQGGRISSGSTTIVINVDSAPTGALGGELSVVSLDGTVQSGTVTNVSGNQLTISPALSSAPQQNAIWVLSTRDIEAQTFRVVTVSETDAGQFEITGIAHNPDKYDAVENGLVLEPRQISTLSDPPPAPDNLVVNESLYESRAEVRTRISVSWDYVPTATAYLVSYKREDGNYVQLPQTNANSVDIDDVQPGVYTIRVVSQTAIGKKSLTASTKTQQIFGKTLPPADVSNFSMVPMSGNAMLSWTIAPDLDVQVGGWVRIRHTPLTAGQDWNNAVDILPSLPGTATHATAPLLTGTYMAKFVDSSGNQSVTMAEIVTTVPYADAINVVQTYTESPLFAGVKSGCVVAVEGLELDSALTIDEDTDLIDTWPQISAIGGLASSATYDFENTLDLGGIYPTRITASIQTFAFDIGSVIDSRTDLLDVWLDIDGDKVDNANASIYMRSTLQVPSNIYVAEDYCAFGYNENDILWTEWKPFFVSEYSAAGFQFQARLTTADVSNNIAIQSLQVTADMPDRTDAQAGIDSGAGTKSVSFNYPFMATPTIGITANSLASGDYFEITNKTSSGFDIIFKNSGGTAISRTFDVLAKGYGRRIS